MLRLYGTNGRLLLQQALKEGTSTVHTVALGKGVYFYQVLAGSKVLQSGRLEKQ